ncbi:hypothetical protein ACSC9U_26530 [Pseudomonas solani]|uniref:hypothetical protein n=1 Tax=Pseudomonas solani TaxID=2731552 RepID=UPI003F4AB50C
MSDMGLPSGILSFFERSTRRFTALYKPIWLINELHHPVWIINTGSEIRDVSGVLKGGVRLSWRRMLPGGRFTSSAYSLPLEQAKMLVVWAHDGVISSGAKSLRCIEHYFLYLFWLIEFLAVRYGERFQIEGFAVVGVDDIVEFLEAAEEGGSCGIGAYIQRWEGYLFKQMGFAAESLEKIQHALAEVGAYDSKGKLDLKFVASAIDIDPRRLSLSSAFKKYAEQYAIGNSSIAIGIDLPRDTDALAVWVARFCGVLSSLPIQSCAELDDARLISEIIRPFRGKGDGRTKTISLSVGRNLIAGCCRWMIDTLPAYRDYLSRVISASQRIMNDSEVGMYPALTISESMIPVPAELEMAFNTFKRMQAEKLIAESKVRTQFPFSVFLFRQHAAVCFCLVTMLACCRRSEIIDLQLRSIEEARGRFYLSVFLRKSGEGSIRREMKKPVPRLVYDCFETLNDLKGIWKLIAPSDDPLFEQQVFYKVNIRGAFPLTANDAYVLLRELSEALDLKDGNGQRWIVAPHQLRRFFAMTFFNFSGAENSLPALSWFMGHDDIEKTWRYIKESLTGKELSASEAALATSAVCSDDMSEGVEVLRSIVRRHFNCDRISVMSEDELRDYLELLSEKGVYTATPIQIGSGRKKIYTIAISIRGKAHV